MHDYAHRVSSFRNARPAAGFGHCVSVRKVFVRQVPLRGLQTNEICIWRSKYRCESGAAILAVILTNCHVWYRQERGTGVPGPRQLRIQNIRNAAKGRGLSHYSSSIGRTHIPRQGSIARWRKASRHQEISSSDTLVHPISAVIICGMTPLLQISVGPFRFEHRTTATFL